MTTAHLRMDLMTVPERDQARPPPGSSPPPRSLCAESDRERHPRHRYCCSSKATAVVDSHPHRCSCLIGSAAGAVTVHDMLSPLVLGRSGSGRRHLVPCVGSAPGQTQGHGALWTALALAPAGLIEPECRGG
jgi:hypothetical protein